MLLVITTLDGIITDDKKSVKNALNQYNQDHAAFLEQLGNLLVVEHDTEVYESTLRVSSYVLSFSPDVKK